MYTVLYMYIPPKSEGKITLEVEISQNIFCKRNS